MSDSPLNCLLSVYCVRRPGAGARLRKPNSSLRTRAVGTSQTVSTPWGGLEGGDHGRLGRMHGEPARPEQDQQQRHGGEPGGPPPAELAQAVLELAEDA